MSRYRYRRKRYRRRSYRYQRKKYNYRRRRYRYWSRKYRYRRRRYGYRETPLAVALVRTASPSWSTRGRRRVQLGSREKIVGPGRTRTR